MFANLKKVLVIVGLTAVSGSAIAETATDTIEVHAGLAAALTFSCTDLHFGVWRVSPGNSEGAITIGSTLSGTIFTTTTENPTDGNYANSLAENHQPMVAVCVATGSEAALNTQPSVQVNILTGDFLPLAADHKFVLANFITTPNTAIAMSYTLLVSTPTAINEEGESRFSIGGTWTVPANIVADHHGGYVSEGVHTVTFNDTAGGDASL